MNLSRINNLIAFNPYYVNGHSPCMPEGRRMSPTSGWDAGSTLALREPATNSKKLAATRQRRDLVETPAPRAKSTLPALLHKGRVLFVCKEAYSDVVNKFTNSLMKGGNQQKAEGILRRCRMFIKIKGKKTSKFSYQAIQNVKPLVELKNQQKSKGSRRKQKSTPAPISQKRGIKLAVQRIIEGARKRPERTMALRLYIESLNAYIKKGYAMKKKTDSHNQCQVSFFHSGGLQGGSPARPRGPVTASGAGSAAAA